MPPSKKIVFSLTLFVGVWLVAEIIASVAISLKREALFSYKAVLGDLARSATVGENVSNAAARGELTWGDYVEILHPYFGYVADPTSNKPFWEVSDLGFVFAKEREAVMKRSDERLIVAVFGGSFANGQYQRLKALLESKTTELKRAVHVVNFSLAGYKQPQQLIVLNYMLAIGAEFDIVINVDGFNDVTLPLVENRLGGVNPYFPRGWDRRTAASVSQAELRKIGYIELVRFQRAKWANLVLNHYLYISPMVCLLWGHYDEWCSDAIARSQQDLAVTASKEKNYTMRGPSYDYSDEQKFFQDLATVWKNSSVQMEAICKAKGAQYFHFLQPNQYVPESKPMDASEEKTAKNMASPYVRGVMRGYPLLGESGAELLRLGVRFTDLRNVFQDVREQVYVDDCCHLNGFGYDIVAGRIYEEIIRESNASKK